MGRSLPVGMLSCYLPPCDHTPQQVRLSLGGLARTLRTWGESPQGPTAWLWVWKPRAAILGRTLWPVTIPEPQMKGTSWVARRQESPRGLQPPHPGHTPGPSAQRPHQQPQRERHGHLRPQGLSHTLLLSHTPPLGPVATGKRLGLKEEATRGTALNTLPLVTM